MQMTKPFMLAAFVFVQEFLGQDKFDKRAHGRYLREMKRFIDPDGDEVPIAAEDVLGCLRAMKAGLFEFEGEIHTVHVITYGNPPYLTQWYEYKTTPPPWYNVSEVKQWEALVGQKAYPECDIMTDFAPHVPR